MRRLTGGFEPVAVETASDSRIVALVKDRDWDAYYARVTLDLEASGGIARVRVREADSPADLAPTERMSEREALAALETRLEDASASGLFSGAVMIARHGEPVFAYAAGQADRERAVANTIDTRFRVASLNKMFTAVAILQLVEEGRVELSAPLGAYLPDYPNAEIARRVTVEHLLTHTGGTGDIFGPAFAEHRLALRGHADYLTLFGERGPAFEPGDHFAYSNYGFVLLGAILEAVTGESYYEHVQEHVLDPAGMRATGFLPEHVAVPGLAIGYTAADGALRSAEGALPHRGAAWGGGYSTVGDLLRFAEALADGRLLGAAMTEAATRARVAADPPAGGYGYGFFVSEVGGAASFGHTGRMPGASAELRVFPQSGYVVAVAANVDSQFVYRIAPFIGARLPLDDPLRRSRAWSSARPSP